jgi:hypothetical protein
LAGYHQLWRARIASKIVSKAEGESGLANDQVKLLLDELRADYRCWAETWMTPAAAQQNTMLIFDALIEYSGTGD